MANNVYAFGVPAWEVSYALSTKLTDDTPLPDVRWGSPIPQQEQGRGSRPCGRVVIQPDPITPSFRIVCGGRFRRVRRSSQVNE